MLLRKNMISRKLAVEPYTAFIRQLIHKPLRPSLWVGDEHLLPDNKSPVRKEIVSSFLTYGIASSE